MNARGLAVVFLLVTAPALGAPSDPHFAVDQFGWRPGERKHCVLSDPQGGYDAPDPYTPGAMLEVRRVGDDSVAFTGPVAAWGGGATHTQSGDRAWWFDFTDLRDPGAYYVHDPVAGLSSEPFEIREDVYRPVLGAAIRTFYYQLCGAPKTASHAGADWADAACHAGAEQDTDCRAVWDTSPATSRDLSGGWHDAGDYNKYVNFADGAVHDLLSAYEENPGAFGDDLNLPESGNGVPDVLDVAKWELDWFLKMQNPDGSVLHKISVTDWSAASPPSADTAPRRYAPATASATISACGALAHAAIVYRGLADPGMQFYSGVLESGARNAWAWLEANPGAIPSRYDNAGFVNADGEDGAYEQAANRVCAAAFLHALTGEVPFRGYVDANYAQIHLLVWGYAYPFESQFQDCLLYYAATPGATPAVAGDIRSAYTASVSGADNLDHIRNEEDAYRAYLADADYTWGSNWTKSSQGSMYGNMLFYGLDPANSALYEEAAQGYVHSIHGVNPTGLAFLSNMGAYGAENSIQEFYHSWFGDGTDWDNAAISLYGPAPGFLPGGPNPSYAPDPAYTGPPIEPPENQPIQKSYRDWNTGWPENSWEVTENQCAYQAAFVKLLSAFVPPVAALAVTVPVSVAACAGTDVHFEVTAGGGTPPYAYAWRKETIPLPEVPPYSGTATARLTIAGVSVVDAGDYDVEVTDSVSATVVSATATLLVDEPPAWIPDPLRVAWDGTRVLLSWFPATGATAYDIRRCDASAGPCTPALLGSVAGTGWTDPDPAARLLWYDVRAVNGCGEAP